MVDNMKVVIARSRFLAFMLALRRAPYGTPVVGSLTICRRSERDPV